jgi:hypothetical protein
VTDSSEENTMKRAILLVPSLLVIVPTLVWPALDATEARSLQTITPSVRFARCFQNNELSESLATLKLQGGVDVTRVSENLLTKARNAPRCRTQVVQALIRGMEQATNLTTNQYENYFLWQHGASLLAELKATEALDLLIANIDITDGLSTSLSHCPALVAILRIGEPAILKLQTVLSQDAEPVRRNFAALAIAYIGGGQARRALTTALPSETDPCVKNFLRVSLQAFNNRAKPNHISSELNGKWLSAFYCL